MDVSGCTLIGKKRIAILLPARYQNLSVIDRDRRETWKFRISSKLTDLCGGSTQEAELGGTFKQSEANYVDEPILRIYSVAGEEILSDTEIKKKLLEFAKEVCAELHQCCIGVEWGDELWFAEQKENAPPKRISFRNLPKYFQGLFATVALRRLQNLEGLGPLLSLDSWELTNSKDLQVPPSMLDCLCTKKDRKAWISKVPISNLSKITLQQLSETDLVFDQENSTAIRVWMLMGKKLRGGRELRLVSDDGKIPRSSFELTLSLLNAAGSDDLREVIDRLAITGKFFQEYKSLRDAASSSLAKYKLPKEECEREAQVLLGRLMFLRFLERKGIMEEKNYLRNRYCANYYDSFLAPMFFEVLDVPKRKRKIEFDSPLPFLNGGLFNASTRRNISFPDKLFDPTEPTSILTVFNKFEFTIDEHATAEEEVSVDPSMFGLVLESLADPEHRKSQGIHYTPAIIAQTLAFQSISRRIADMTAIGLQNLIDFYRNNGSGPLSEDQAEAVLDRLETLRILDPAVGSGSLLLASLRVMMDYFKACKERLGESVQRGKKAWSTMARKFVRNCLFGVDIDRDAVEIARLRLWLALAVEDEKDLRPLPDLSYNIKVGDSLSEIIEDEIGAPELEFDQTLRAKNEFRRALKEYSKAEDEEIRSAALSLEQSEREYLVQYLSHEKSTANNRQIAALKRGEPLPFRWHIHYGDVFKSKNSGFDIVIANPPYVRIQQLGQEELIDYKTRFKAMELRNADLYLAFVEQALKLAGKAGQIAFIMPNFARTQAGLPLRKIIEERGAVEQWVDFGDLQVFPTASNYVALLYATSKKNRRKTFDCRTVEEEIWQKHRHPDWISQVESESVTYQDFWGHLNCSKTESGIKGLTKREPVEGTAQEKEIYAPNIWRTCSHSQMKQVSLMEKGSIPLGQLAKISIGVQTSKDVVYLLNHVVDVDSKLLTVHSELMDKDFTLERAALLRCAKGSVHIKPYSLSDKKVWCLWPYDKTGELLKLEELVHNYPEAWKYLEACEPTLRQREGGRFERDDWWRFRRPQGTKVSRRPNKIIVPSIMSEATAFLDRTGDVAFTASGKGGGGAWGIELWPDEKRVTIEWQLAVLNSNSVWNWLLCEGDRKSGGWRGVDQALLQRIPVPIPSASTLKEIANLISEIFDALENSHFEESKSISIKNTIDGVVASTYSKKQ